MRGDGAGDTRWDTAYGGKGWKEVAWFQENLRLQDLIVASGVPVAIVDVGGGASALGVRLLEAGSEM
ncbi:hypothetical protein [Catenulispora subtropica]|uniref:Uncharacterized protein n=1 Tax=Catenulispora subtropica TaxID=450798 RepID=A0ABP5C6S5_9ACTN